jgi:hypothetical protein
MHLIHIGRLIIISPERTQSLEAPVPIRYVSLQPSHLQQVHDLLARAFWDGIDGSLHPSGPMMFLTSSCVYSQLATCFSILPSAAL